MAERKISKRNQQKYLEGLVLQQAADASAMTLQKQPAWIGVDWGEKWSGIAISPDGKGVITHSVVPTGQLKSTVLKLKKEYKMVHMALGISISADGKEAPQCTPIRAFAAQLSNTLEVHFVDERNTTIHRRNERTDDAAAALILQYGMAQYAKQLTNILSE